MSSHVLLCPHHKAGCTRATPMPLPCMVAHPATSGGSSTANPAIKMIHDDQRALPPIENSGSACAKPGFPHPTHPGRAPLRTEDDVRGRQEKKSEAAVAVETRP